MLRTASAADLNALIELRCIRYGTAKDDAAGWLQNVAGLDNVLVVERPDGTPAAMLAAVPVRYRHRQGVWFCGAAAGAEVPREMLLTRLLTGCLRAFAAKGYDFAVFAPETEEETQALEPDEVYDSRAVGEVGHEALLAAFAQFLEAEYLALQLDVGHRAVDFADLVEAAAVDVLVGIVVEQVAHTAKAEVFLQNLGPLRAYARHVLYLYG